MIAIATAATKSYLHIWPQFIRSISTASMHHETGLFIMATDESKEAREAINIARREFPEDWVIRSIILNVNDQGIEGKDYEVHTQLRIAQLQGAAFMAARRARATSLWSVESDVIVPANALRVSEWVLQMPREDGSSYYDIAAATYFNGLFLGGFGDYQHAIAEDFLEKERKVPERMKLLIAKNEERLKQLIEEKKEENTPAIEKEHKRANRLRKRLKKCPPDGTVWEMIAKHGWRRRGWLDFAYPGIGLGSIVPSDWCGLGCTLLNQRALALADFAGYEGKGTQDLFLCWHRWNPAGLKIACLPHVLCDHVKRRGKDSPKGSPEIIHHRAYHEPAGEYRGHIRVRQQEWKPC